MIDGFGQQKMVSDIQALVNYQGNDSVVLVKDNLQGGVFYLESGKLVPDNGIVFERKRGGGYWIRKFDITNGVNPCWWGAKGDGKHDDLQAIKSATESAIANICSLVFPSGIFRITDQWLIGGKPVEEKDLFIRSLGKEPSWNVREYAKGRFTNPLIIRGDVNTIIYGDFTSTTLKAIIYYGSIGNGNSKQPSAQHYTHTISNIAVFGQGSFSGTSPTPQNVKRTSSNQIGLVVYRSPQFRVDGCKFAGLQIGLFMQDTYFSEVVRTQFAACETGFYGIGSHASLYQSLYSDNCKTGIDLFASAISANSIHFQFCETGLVYGGEAFIVNGIYCENDNMSKPNNYQLVFNNAKQVQINGGNLTSGGRPIVLVSKDASDIKLNACNLNGLIQSNNKNNKIDVSNSRGYFKFSGLGVFNKN